MYSEEEMKSVLDQYKECIRKIYFLYIHKSFDCGCGHCGVEDLSLQLSMICDHILNETNEKYADHIEGIRNHI